MSASPHQTGKNGRFNPNHVVNTIDVMRMRVIPIEKMADCTDSHTMQEVLDICNGAALKYMSTSVHFCRSSIYNACVHKSL